MTKQATKKALRKNMKRDRCVQQQGFWLSSMYPSTIPKSVPTMSAPDRASICPSIGEIMFWSYTLIMC